MLNYLQSNFTWSNRNQYQLFKVVRSPKAVTYLPSPKLKQFVSVSGAMGNRVTQTVWISDNSALFSSLFLSFVCLEAWRSEWVQVRQKHSLVTLTVHLSLKSRSRGCASCLQCLMVAIWINSRPRWACCRILTTPRTLLNFTEFTSSQTPTGMCTGTRLVSVCVSVCVLSRAGRMAGQTSKPLT